MKRAILLGLFLWGMASTLAWADGWTLKRDFAMVLFFAGTTPTCASDAEYVVIAEFGGTTKLCIDGDEIANVPFSYETTQSLATSGQIDCGTAARYRTVRVEGSGGNVNLSSNPQILAGTDTGQRCTICGGHAANTVILDDGDGVEMAADGASITFVEDTNATSICADFVWTGSLWRQVTGPASGADDQTAAEVPFTPAGPIAADDVQEAIEEVASEAPTFFTHATSCPDNVTTAQLGDSCLDLDGSALGHQYWECTDPANDVGAGSASFCDEYDNWTGGHSLYLYDNGTLNYLLSDGSKVIQSCNDRDYDSGTFCHRWTIDPTDGPIYQGVCGFSTPGDPTTPLPCEVNITTASTKDLNFVQGTTTYLTAPAGKNLLIPTTDGYLGIRSGTAAPDSAACNESAEVGNLYLETDQAPGQMLWTCDTDGWKQQGLRETRHWVPAAGCNNATAGTVWDLPTSNPAVAACSTGTNTQKGTLDFADGSNLSAQITHKLPSTWTGAIDANIKWFSATASTNNVVWQLATICVADAETDDPAFNTASTVTDAGKGTTLQTNDATITGVTTTGCAAGELIHFRIQRDSGHASDTFAGTARLIGVELVIREAY